MPAEVIEGVERDIEVRPVWRGGMRGAAMQIQLGRSEARQLVSEAILACERFDQWRATAKADRWRMDETAAAVAPWPQLHVLSRVAALLLSAGASEKPPAAVVREAKDAYDRAPVDVEAASMGGQCCEPYQAPRAERRSLLETDRLRRELREAQGALQAALDARDACEDAWRGAETMFSELLGRLADAERQLLARADEADARRLRRPQGTLAPYHQGRRSAFNGAASKLREILDDYEAAS